MIKLCTNCYWKHNKDTEEEFCSYHESPIRGLSCKDHTYMCCGSHRYEKQAEVVYNDNAYCEDCLLKELGITKEPSERYFYYDANENYICNDSDHDILEEFRKLGHDIEGLEY